MKITKSNYKSIVKKIRKTNRKIYLNTGKKVNANTKNIVFSYKKMVNGKGTIVARIRRRK